MGNYVEDDIFYKRIDYEWRSAYSVMFIRY